MKLAKKGGGSEYSMQDTALNGAQVTAAIDIVMKVSMGELSIDSAVQMLMTFFQISRTEAENMVNPASQYSEESNGEEDTKK